MDARNIIITGFMGTGKTAVAQELAQRLGREFVDTDQLIEKRVGIPISRIFADFGEPHFRRLEKEVGKELAQTGGLVASTGGGMLLDAENRKLLTASGIVICLKCSPDKILSRVGKTGDRPLLHCSDPGGRIDTLLRRENPFIRLCRFT